MRGHHQADLPSNQTSSKETKVHTKMFNSFHGYSFFMPNCPDVITNSTWWPPYLCASGTDPGSTLPPLAYCRNSSVWAALTATFRIPSTTSCWVCYIPDGPSIIKCTNSGHCHDSTFESAASLSGPLSGLGVDLENMQFFTVRTKFPLTSSTGSFSAEKNNNN